MAFWDGETKMLILPCGVRSKLVVGLFGRAIRWFIIWDIRYTIINGNSAVVSIIGKRENKPW
jgi:hypothetical protein